MITIGINAIENYLINIEIIYWGFQTNTEHKNIAAVVRNNFPIAAATPSTQYKLAWRAWA